MIDDRAVEAAIAKFAEYGIEFASPRDGDLDDLELERYNALSDALSAAAPFLTQIPDGWKTIDTAPKDGTRILIWHGNIEIARWADLNVSFATRYGWRDDCSEFREVTHWQPLPLPPPTEKNDG